jgi:hypothetical protein
MRRFASLICGLCSIVLLGGCPGALSNPDDFVDGGTGPEPRSAQDVFDDSCATVGCHDDVTLAGELDLLSPGVESRVVDVASKAIGCETDILVVAGDPDNSYMMDKINGAFGICGSQMPLLDTLPPDDVEIIRQWIIDLGDSGSGTPDGG